MGATLTWGQRYLMCRPDHFRVEYAINPWMTALDPVDPALALTQWDRLRRALLDAGAVVDVQCQSPDLPDQVFAMNLGYVDAGRAVVSRFRHPQRQAEAALGEQWLTANGFEVLALPELDAQGLRFEAGDAFPIAGRLVFGHGFRSDDDAWSQVAAALGAPAAALRLVDERFYHLDTCLCPLDETTALVVPTAFDTAGLDVLSELVPDPVLLGVEDAFAFAANSVVVGRTVVMPSASDRLRGELTERGFTVVTVAVGEFLKSGGAVRCLTLPLDARLTAAVSA